MDKKSPLLENDTTGSKLSGHKREIDDHLRFVTQMLRPISLPFVILDVSGRIIWCNDAFSGLTGYSLKELSAMDRSQLSPYGRGDAPPHMMECLSAGKMSVSFEKEYLRKDGARVPVEIYADIICDRDGEPQYYYAFATDLSERKSMESLLKRYELIFESARDIVFFTDGEGRIIEVNPAAVQVYGYTHDELLSMNLRDLRVPEERRDARKQLDECFAGCLYETVHIRKDESTFPVEVNSRGVEIGGRRLLIGVIRDTTERKRFEEELSEARSQAELYLDLISHDINNMNQVGMSYLELAMDEPGLSPDVSRMLEKPLKELEESSRLISIVRKLRQATGPDARLEAVDLKKVLEEAVSQFEGQAGGRILLHVMTGPGYTVKANELLRDVFANLIGNAIKYSGAQAVVETSLKTARERNADYYRVDVDDNGPGIPDELKKKIFMRYQRGVTRKPGTGLGLYLVSVLVKSFGGRAWVEDRVKGDSTKGSRFSLLLPAA